MNLLKQHWTFILGNDDSTLLLQQKENGQILYNCLKCGGNRMKIITDTSTLTDHHNIYHREHNNNNNVEKDKEEEKQEEENEKDDNKFFCKLCDQYLDINHLRQHNNSTKHKLTEAFSNNDTCYIESCRKNFATILNISSNDLKFADATRILCPCDDYKQSHPIVLSILKVHSTSQKHVLYTTKPESDKIVAKKRVREEMDSSEMAKEVVMEIKKDILEELKNDPEIQARKDVLKTKILKLLGSE